LNLDPTRQPIRRVPASRVKPTEAGQALRGTGELCRINLDRSDSLTLENAREPLLIGGIGLSLLPRFPADDVLLELPGIGHQGPADEHLNVRVAHSICIESGLPPSLA